jgi:hypothetical protein
MGCDPLVQTKQIAISTLAAARLRGPAKRLLTERYSDSHETNDRVDPNQCKAGAFHDLLVLSSSIRRRS